ncbi:MAG: flagellar biosynthesis protein FlgE [Pseudomonadales bacterium]|nr:flagellar biosynthesis protein FlgE [Pseudomonadales bacterium]
MSNTLLQVGTTAMQAGMQQAGQAAAEIASVAKNNDASLNHSIVDLLQAENHVKASAQVVKTANQMMGTMIDIFV